MTRPVVLIAASGLARETLPVLRETGRQVLGLLDDRHAELPPIIGGVPLLGGIDAVRLYDEAELLICVGSGPGRERLVSRLRDFGVDDSRYATVIDPSVRNPGNSPIGAGSILLAGVTITADAQLGRHVVVMPRVIITHDCRIDDYATFAAGVALGGFVRIGRGAYLGMNASVRQRVAIGVGATVGMGAVVLHDIPDHQTWAGVPARQLILDRDS